MQKKELEKWALKIRSESLKMIHLSTGGHPGGALSIADILAVLYFHQLRVDPQDPEWEKRDRCILSKGHGCAALYAALGLKGYFPREEFTRFRRLDGLLQGHPSVSIPGIDAPSGSLGMGLSQGLGMALGARARGLDFRTYVILGDGDMQEGSTWEALMAGGHHRLSGLCAILDANGLQADGAVRDTMDIEPIVTKLEAFGWQVLEIDGHSIEQIVQALERAGGCKDRPSFLVARSLKGKGVSYMENRPQWHGTVRLTEENLKQALSELWA